MIRLPKLGQPLHEVEKRADEEITYTIDLSEYLEKNEVVTEIVSTTNTSKCRSRKGIYMEATVPVSTIEGAALHKKYLVSIVYKTNLGNTRSIAFNVKVYK